MSIVVAIYVFPKAEVLDFAGPFEVFTTASRVYERRNPNEALPFRVHTVARSIEPITARAGLRVLPDYTFENCPPADVLIVPGGAVDAEMRDPVLIRWIAKQSGRASIIASVCTGAFLLAEAGLLSGKAATTHWEDQESLQASYPSIEVRSQVRWVDEGEVVTSAGIAAGIDMSLHLVSRLASPELAKATAKQLDVPY